MKRFHTSDLVPFPPVFVVCFLILLADECLSPQRSEFYEHVCVRVCVCDILYVLKLTYTFYFPTISNKYAMFSF